MRVTATWNIPDNAAPPKWLRVIEALANQYGGCLTTTQKTGKLVTK